MKIFDFFDINLTNFNHSKSRKIKLLVCSLIFLISFTTIGYRTITLASVKKDNLSKTVNKKIETRTFKENLRGNTENQREPKEYSKKLEGNRMKSIETQRNTRLGMKPNRNLHFQCGRAIDDGWGYTRAMRKLYGNPSAERPKLLQSPL